MKVDCIDVYYQEGSFTLVQGLKKGTPERYDEHGHHQPRGYGYGQITTKSGMILVIESDDLASRIANINLGDFFKYHWGNLTPQRRVAIINTMPDSIEVEEDSYSSGELYYTVDEPALFAWLDRAKADQIRARKNRKRMKTEIKANQARKQQSLFDE